MDTERLYDPELDRMVGRDEVPQHIWDELVSVNEFLMGRD